MLPIIGGILIGAAASLLLLFNGRVTGISGIIGGALKAPSGEYAWRWYFLGGLFTGGLMLAFLRPESFVAPANANLFDYALAGLLVGFGTVMGNGCTSGHGVCGISRLSMRSILATVTFIGFGVLGLLLFKLVRGGV